jgi:hypothetical protein
MAMNVSTLTALIEARRLINNGWIQKMFARNAQGHMCGWNSEEAKSYCSIGAIYKASNWSKTYNTGLCFDVFNALSDHIGIERYGQGPAECIVFFNDAPKRTKAEVLDAFDKAIASQMRVEPVVETRELVEV